jgi:hypothetical protein
MSLRPRAGRDWSADEYGRDFSARIPGKKLNEWFERNPTRDIIIHAPGGDATMICARYSYTPQPPSKWRVSRAMTSADRGQSFRATDVRAWVPWVVRFGSIYPRDRNRLRWNGGVHDGYHCNTPDYAAIIEAVELIRSVHGRVRVEWSLNFHCPGSLAPVNPRGARLLITDEFDRLAPQ